MRCARGRVLDVGALTTTDRLPGLALALALKELKVIDDELISGLGCFKNSLNPDQCVLLGKYATKESTETPDCFTVDIY